MCEKKRFEFQSGERESESEKFLLAGLELNKVWGERELLFAELQDGVILSLKKHRHLVVDGRDPLLRLDEKREHEDVESAEVGPPRFPLNCGKVRQQLLGSYDDAALPSRRLHLQPRQLDRRQHLLLRQVQRLTHRSYPGHFVRVWRAASLLNSSRRHTSRRGTRQGVKCWKRLRRWLKCRTMRRSRNREAVKCDRRRRSQKSDRHRMMRPRNREAVQCDRRRRRSQKSDRHRMRSRNREAVQCDRRQRGSQKSGRDRMRSKKSGRHFF